MNSALLPMLLFVLFYFQIYSANSTECRGIPTDKMEKTFKYTSAKPGHQTELVEIKYSPSNLHDKEIYIGFTGKNQNLPKNKCVIIKIYNNDDRSKQLYENSVKILNKLKEIDDPENDHFVNLIDYNFDEKHDKTSKSPQKKYLTILELGERDLEEELSKLHRRLSLEEYKKMLKDIMKPLVKFHKVGIHLDFKLKNLIVVEKMMKSKHKKKTLFGTKECLEKVKVKTFKLIDFDGSVLYLNREKKGKIAWDLMGHTEVFSAPELLQNLSLFTEGDIEVNPKMDVWSAGITIFQILLIPKTKWRQLELTFEKVALVGQLFRCAKLNSVSENEMKQLSAKHGQNANANQQSSAGLSSETSSEEEHDVVSADLVLLLNLMRLPVECVHPGEKNWWKNYWAVIADILSIWTEMPEIVFLSVNMLNIEPGKRMTAQGAVDYLEGKCKPKEYEENAEKIALFGDVSAEKLRELMEKEGFKQEKMGSVKEKLRTAEKNLKLFLKKLEKRKEFCDQ